MTQINPTNGYKCEHCNASYSTLASLYTHKAEDHPVKNDNTIALVDHNKDVEHTNVKSLAFTMPARSSGVLYSKEKHGRECKLSRPIDPQAQANVLPRMKANEHAISSMGTPLRVS